jgi:hypothetical protein
MFWVVNPYTSERPQHEGRLKLSLSLASADFLLGLRFDPEDRGDILLRNVEVPPNYRDVTTQRVYALLNVNLLRVMLLLQS